jgi:ribosomal protein S18 acetylase RimI-like enzyme
VTVRYRRATADDVAGIAELHADSWRRHYRGAYSDAFLDGDVHADRKAVWSERLTAVGADSVTVVAEDERVLVGFAHTRLDAHPDLGALLDNLHVAYALKRDGIGTRLMAESAAAVLELRPGRGLYLRVLEQNTAAQAFYEARGGRRVGRDLGGPFPGGGRAFVFVYAWPDPSTLLVDRRPSG